MNFDCKILIIISVSCALRETTYPFMAVACLRDNRMMVVGRLQGVYSALIISENVAVLNNYIYSCYFMF